MNRERIEQILSLTKDELSKATNNLSKEGLTRNLKKLGFATADDIRELNDKIDDLAAELRGQISKIKKSSAPKTEN